MLQKKCVISRVVLLFLALGPSLGDSSNTLQILSRAHLEFALDLFRQVAKDTLPRDNILISPHSVSSVLSQLWLGAGENSRTFQQLQRTLHYKQGSLDQAKVHQAFQSSLDTVSDPDFQSVVQQGNAVFVQAGITVNPTYKSSLNEYYNASVEELDFKNDESSARSRINRWVSERTDGRIPELLETPLSEETKILLVNALALKAFWKTSFDPAMTASNGIFHYDQATKMEIPMMAGKFKVLLGESEELQCRLLELPFRGKRLSMFVLLPNEGSDMDLTDPPPFVRLERNLTAINLKKLFLNLREEMVHIRMPRFSLTETIPLAETLVRLGLGDIFDPTRANFSGISTEDPLYVSAMAHKVTMKVTELGAEGAAATATGIERFGEIGEFFEINKPFLFFIWDYHSGALLFMSRVAVPTPIF